MVMVSILRVVGEMQRIPRGYGVAWYAPDRMAAICLPWPVNRIAGGFRAFYLEWKLPQGMDVIATAYQNGYRDGFKEGKGLIEQRLQFIENRMNRL